VSVQQAKLDGQRVLITGGTGSFGKRAAQMILEQCNPARLVIFSRDELKQSQMQADPVFAPHADKLRFFIGNVRDRERLQRAFDGMDIIIHAAALKQVPAAEYNPFEAVKTNVIGAQNIIDCAIDRGVKRIIALSTDKAANPVNVYGATKLCSDKLFVAGNAYTGSRDLRMAVVRYGNVVGSRGSVIPLFLKQRKKRRISITDERMTRFWITLDQGVRFVMKALTITQGGEIFVPKIPSMRILDLARAIAPDAQVDTVGIRPGEKLHEIMVPEDDARSTVELDDYFVILPFAQEARAVQQHWRKLGTACPDRFRYSSETNPHWLTDNELAEMISDLDLPEAREWIEERAGVSRIYPRTV